NRGPNVAVTLFAAFAVTEQVPLPLQAPPQASSREPLPGCAVSVTTCPWSKFAAQVPGHESPAGLLTTVPDARLASTDTVSGIWNANTASIRAAASIVTTHVGCVPSHGADQRTKRVFAPGVAVSVNVAP